MNSKQFTEGLDEEIHLVGADIVFVLRLLAAFIFIVIGFIGIILPVVPDWPLFVVGIVLLDTNGKIREKILTKTPQKYKKIVKKILFFVKVKNKENRRKNV